MVKVIVMMSTYNGEKYIREQIESILAQKGDFDLDLWVRDDGSDDRTKSILQNYAEKGLLKWYTGRNLGPAMSFLNLVKKCKGYDFYAFADQDDFWESNKIQAAINHLKGEVGIRVYFANAELVNSDLEYLGRNVYRKSPKLDLCTLSCAGGILGCTTVFNNELAEIIQNEKLPRNVVMHDFYVNELCLALGGKITYDEKPYMKYRQHSSNVIGVSHGVMDTVISRINDIIYVPKVSIAEQAEEIIRIHNEKIDGDAYVWLKKVAAYKRNIWKRIILACSVKTRYINWNMGLKLRLSILLGNR